MTLSKNEKWVLITGASTGIGRACAEYLASKGFKIYAGARKQKDLDELNELDNIVSLKLDITIPDEIDEALKFVKSQGTGLYHEIRL